MRGGCARLSKTFQETKFEVPLTETKAKNATTLSEIASHLALSRTAARDLEIQGILHRTDGLDACRLAYIRHLRSCRRSNAADDQLRLARAKAIELRTLREAHNLVPCEESLAVVDAVMGKLIFHLDTVPARCTRDCSMRRIIESEIDRARTATADECKRQAQFLRESGKAASPKWP
jgi:hypothetical protein